MKVAHCLECQKEFKNSASLASHRYRSHGKKSSNTDQMNDNENMKFKSQPGSTVSQPKHSAINDDKADIDILRKDIATVLTLVKNDIQELEENVSSNKRTLRIFRKRFEEAVKAIKGLQKDVYEIDDKSE